MGGNPPFSLEPLLPRAAAPVSSDTNELQSRQANLGGSLEAVKECRHHLALSCTYLIPAEYSVVFGYSECLAGAGAARCAPALYFANINNQEAGARVGGDSTSRIET